MRYDHALGDRCMAIDRRFNFRRFDAISKNLDLFVRAAEIRYFSAGQPYACQATVVVDAANIDALRRQIVLDLGLGTPGSPDAAVTAFADQYLLDDMSEIYRKDGSIFVVHADTTSRLLWRPDTGQPTISVIVF